MQGSLARLFRDQRGASAVEFALIAPVLIALYFGLSEYSQAMMADRKATHVASSIGDLVAQSQELTASDVADIFTIGAPLMAPFSSGTLKMRVANVTVDPNNVAKVTWGKGSNWTGRAKTEVVTLPKNIVNAGESVVMSEAEYSYNSPVNYFIKSPMVFKETFYLRPRKSDAVVCKDC